MKDIIYAILVWGSANDTELEKILILQKKAVRMMLFKDQYPQIPGPLNPSDPLFTELGILKIHDVFKLHVSKFIYDCLSHSTPSMFWNWFMYNFHIHSYNTTSNSTINMKNYFEIDSVIQTNILHTQCSNLVNYGAKMIKVAGPLLWNSLPEYIRNSESICIFKFNLKKFLLGLYIYSSATFWSLLYQQTIYDFMKITVSKMHTFFVPAFVPLVTYKKCMCIYLYVCVY